MNAVASIANGSAYTQKSTSDLKVTDSGEFTEIMKEKSILDELSEKYNLNVTGSSKFSFGSMTTLTIAPNILKEMANNPQKKAHYEGVIKDYFAQMPQLNAFYAATDSVPLPTTITFNSDGSWVESGGTVPSPEKLARIKKEQEEKKKKKQEEEKLEEETNNNVSLNDAGWSYLSNVDYILGNGQNKDYKFIHTDENAFPNIIVPEEKMFDDINNPMNALVMSSELKGNKLKI